METSAVYFNVNGTELGRVTVPGGRFTVTGVNNAHDVVGYAEDPGVPECTNDFKFAGWKIDGPLSQTPWAFEWLHFGCVDTMVQDVNDLGHMAVTFTDWPQPGEQTNYVVHGTEWLQIEVPFASPGSAWATELNNKGQVAGSILRHERGPGARLHRHTGACGPRQPRDHGGQRQPPRRQRPSEHARRLAEHALVGQRRRPVDSVRPGGDEDGCRPDGCLVPGRHTAGELRREMSANGRSWTTHFTGQSAGSTTQPEIVDFADVPVRYVRIVGHGNTLNLWNSITEVEVYGVEPMSSTREVSQAQ